MATVLHFEPPADISAPHRSETPAERRVRLGSRGLAMLFAILSGTFAATMAIGLAAMLFYQGEALRIGPDGCYIGGGPANSVPFGSLPLDHRLVYVVVGLIRYLPVLMLFWQLRGLFALYTRGQVFSRRAGVAFSRIGGWLCAYALAPLLCHLLLSSTGYEIDKVWLHLASVQAFVLGLLVLVIGQVMQVGHEIEQDAQGFV
ncbi:DUF2975 domain-containing protein [Sphingobium xenophagum]|uniref:DUF2975 domain-containing protein n=1 Tax=Sphingobium xenophagum TaxID=121428 RepID=A0A401J8G9_SPHXE|nr:DUF2975 domain-containing protein [Sphingobium xenophagum]GBH32966.1 hypothetical protein MBESOW_P4192 [Sphingobium xenophagum]